MFLDDVLVVIPVVVAKAPYSQPSPKAITLNFLFSPQSGQFVPWICGAAKKTTKNCEKCKNCSFGLWEGSCILEGKEKYQKQKQFVHYLLAPISGAKAYGNGKAPKHAISLLQWLLGARQRR